MQVQSERMHQMSLLVVDEKEFASFLSIVQHGLFAPAM
jgi:hypothetical protein